MLYFLAGFLKRLWCELTHGGGTIARDQNGWLCWRCQTCGRWSSHPVPPKDESAVIDRDIRTYNFEDKYNCQRCGGSGEEPEAGVSGVP